MKFTSTSETALSPSVVSGTASREYQPAGQLFQMALRNQAAAETIPLSGDLGHESFDISILVA
jgi:hypothetical protein